MSYCERWNKGGRLGRMFKLKILEMVQFLVITISKMGPGEQVMKLDWEEGIGDKGVRI